MMLEIIYPVIPLVSELSLNIWKTVTTITDELSYDDNIVNNGDRITSLNQ